jgi:hypothetical protein
MPKGNYKWTKSYVVNTQADDDVKPGDEIEVGDSNGGSAQRVLSVTERLNQSGKPYKTIIVQSLES